LQPKCSMVSCECIVIQLYFSINYWCQIYRSNVNIVIISSHEWCDYHFISWSYENTELLSRPNNELLACIGLGEFFHNINNKWPKENLSTHKSCYCTLVYKQLLLWIAKQWCDYTPHQKNKLQYFIQPCTSDGLFFAFRKTNFLSSL